jgi:hypothetical protein
LSQISKLTIIGDAKFGCNPLLSKSLYHSDQHLMTEAPDLFPRRSPRKGTKMTDREAVAELMGTVCRSFGGKN